MQKDETVRNTGRNMLAGRMYRTPTNQQLLKNEIIEDYRRKLVQRDKWW